MAKIKLSYAEITFLREMLKALDAGNELSEEAAKETKRLIRQAAGDVVRQGVNKKPVGHASFKSGKVKIPTVKAQTQTSKGLKADFVHRPNVKNTGPNSVEDLEAADKINKILYRNRFIERLEEGFAGNSQEWLIVYSQAIQEALSKLSKIRIYKLVNGTLDLHHVYYDSD